MNMDKDVEEAREGVAQLVGELERARETAELQNRDFTETCAKAELARARFSDERRALAELMVTKAGKKMLLHAEMKKREPSYALVAVLGENIQKLDAETVPLQERVNVAKTALSTSDGVLNELKSAVDAQNIDVVRLELDLVAARENVARLVREQEAAAAAAAEEAIKEKALEATLSASSDESSDDDTSLAVSADGATEGVGSEDAVPVVLANFSTDGFMALTDNAKAALIAKTVASLRGEIRLLSFPKNPSPGKCKFCDEKHHAGRTCFNLPFFLAVANSIGGMDVEYFTEMIDTLCCKVSAIEREIYMVEFAAMRARPVPAEFTTECLACLVHYEGMPRTHEANGACSLFTLALSVARKLIGAPLHDFSEPASPHMMMLLYERAYAANIDITTLNLYPNDMLPRGPIRSAGADSAAESDSRRRSRKRRAADGDSSSRRSHRSTKRAKTAAVTMGPKMRALLAESRRVVAQFERDKEAVLERDGNSALRDFSVRAAPSIVVDSSLIALSGRFELAPMGDEVLIPKGDRIAIYDMLCSELVKVRLGVDESTIESLATDVRVHYRGGSPPPTPRRSSDGDESGEAGGCGGGAPVACGEKVEHTMLIASSVQVSSMADRLGALEESVAVNFRVMSELLDAVRSVADDIAGLRDYVTTNVPVRALRVGNLGLIDTNEYDDNSIWDR